MEIHNNQQKNRVLEFYNNKTIFITGVTGFLGKVIYEKIIRVLPQIKQVIILIRNKKNINVQERFKKDILDSEIFSLLRQQKGSQFYHHINEKTHIVQGDLLQENIGLSASDYEYIKQNANIIVNCAASIDFNAKLEDAINANIKGTLRMYELAKNCKNLMNFVHISTCYVNSDKEGYIEEKIYPSNENPLEVLSTLTSMPPQELELQTKSILGAFPNTYVFTKSLAERILQLQKPPQMTLTIVRPAIIGAAVQQPIQGWVEGVTAASAVFLLSGIGMIRHLHVNPNNIADVIPVDCVSDTIIVTSALCSNSQNLNIFNNGVSYRNPINWELTRKQCTIYWSNNPFAKKIGPIDVKLIANEQILRLFQIKRRITAYGFKQIANIFGNDQMKKNAERFIKMVYKAENVSDTFRPFCVREFIFESKKIDEMLQQLSDLEKQLFYIDVSKIDMPTYYLMFNWGMHKFILNQQVEPPISPEFTDILQVAQYSDSKLSYFPDLNWAVTWGKYFKTRSYEEYKLLILNSPKVQEELKNKANIKEAESIIKEMISNFKMPYIRAMAWFLQKTFSTIYEKIVIYDSNFKAFVSQYDIKKDGPMIMMPTHRSYVDFLLVSFIFFAYKQQTPHIAAAEDFLHMAIVHHILRGSGAFFMKRNQRDNKLYKAIFYEYIQLLLENNCMLEFFVEGTRSRSGKTLHPKFGIMGIVYDAVEQKKINDATILPISISYEKVLEGESFPAELLGESKVKESLKRLIKAANILKQNFGKIYVNFCDPFHVTEYINNNKTSKDNINDISYRVVHTLNQSLICTNTAVVSSIILSCRKKGITEDQLIDKYVWMVDKIKQRGGLLSKYDSQDPFQTTIKSAFRLMEGVVSLKKSVYQVNNGDKKNILMLHYYRNGIMHVFVREAVVCLVLQAFLQENNANFSVNLNSLYEECAFIFDMINEEFAYLYPQNIEQFEQFLNTMEKNNVISLKQNQVSVVDIQQLSFYTNLLLPVVESYWLVFMTFQGQKEKKVSTKQFIEKVQWLFEKMYDERILYHQECQSQDIIKNAINKCKKLGFIKNVNESQIQIVIDDQKISDIDRKLSVYIKNEFQNNLIISPSLFGKQTALAQNNLFFAAKL